LKTSNVILFDRIFFFCCVGSKAEGNVEAEEEVVNESKPKMSASSVSVVVVVVVVVIL